MKRYNCFFVVNKIRYDLTMFATNDKEFFDRKAALSKEIETKIVWLKG